MEDSKKIKVVFAPGAFDNFEGTQEELDQLILEINELCQDPKKMMESSVALDLDDLDEEDEQLLASLVQSENTSSRLLQ